MSRLGLQASHRVGSDHDHWRAHGHSRRSRVRALHRTRWVGLCRLCRRGCWKRACFVQTRRGRRTSGHDRIVRRCISLPVHILGGVCAHAPLALAYDLLPLLGHDNPARSEDVCPASSEARRRLAELLFHPAPGVAAAGARHGAIDREEGAGTGRRLLEVHQGRALNHGRRRRRVELDGLDLVCCERLSFSPAQGRW